MPYPHVDSVLDALRSDWFFTEHAARATASAQGKTYAQKLQEKFQSRPDKDAIDQGLALGWYVSHNQANTQKRIALRAVMLSEVLMRGRPSNQLSIIQRQHSGAPLGVLKRAFIANFPIMQTDPNRAAWNPRLFSNPATLTDLHAPQNYHSRAVPQYMFLAHTNDDLNKPLWQNPVGELAKYSASSLSLISSEKPYTYSKSGMVQGAIFQVPANNILVTYKADLMTVLHSGSIHTGQSEHTFAEEIIELMAATGANGLETPASLLQQTNSGDANTVGLTFGSKYNEVVVCCKPGVPLPWGSTSSLVLSALFLLTTKDGKILQPYDAEERNRLAQQHAARLQVPLLYLPHSP